MCKEPETLVPLISLDPQPKQVRVAEIKWRLSDSSNAIALAIILCHMKIIGFAQFLI